MGRLSTALALLLVACGPPDCPADGGCGCGSGPGTVEVGAGGARLTPLSDGDALDIVRGPQGGVHVVVGAWVSDMALDRVELRLWLEDGDGVPVGIETRRSLTPSLFDPASEGRWQRHPDLVILDDTMADVPRFAGRTVLLHAEAVSSDGSHACDAREVVLTDPDG